MMPKLCRAALVLLALTLHAVLPARAEVATAQWMGDRLRAGELMALQADLVKRLEAAPADDQVRFALGTTKFIMAIEHMAQSMYRHGLQPPRGFETSFPLFRFPVPRNPNPEKLDYQKMRAVFQRTVDALGAADAILAKVGPGDVKLPIAISLARLDLNGDGKSEDGEALWQVLDASLGGGNITAEAAERFIITFDRADVAWLRGYTHLLSALMEFMLAHDWQPSFDSSFHMLFPNAGLPNAILNDIPKRPDEWFDAGPIADVIAFVHLAHWPVAEPERLKAALGHLESVSSLSRESWGYILKETDDEAEWIPSPAQKNGALPGMTISQTTVDGWMLFLDEFDAILGGKKLIPHWRLNKGINFRRVFTQPRPFDPILWAQGSAALPYLEDGPLTNEQTWNNIMEMMEGNFLGYAVWFN
jgi:hypothetical protein